MDVYWVVKSSSRCYLTLPFPKNDYPLIFARVLHSWWSDKRCNALQFRDRDAAAAEAKLWPKADARVVRIRRKS